MSALYRYSALWISALVLVFSVLVASLLLHQQGEALESLTGRELAKHELAWRGVLAQADSRAEIWFDAYLDNPRLHRKLLKAQDPELRDEARAELIAWLEPFYPQMVQAGASIFHVHLADGESFYRAYRPDQFGDNVMAHRHTVRQANTLLQPSAAIESGRLRTAYRHARPIVDPEGRHLGSVEFSVPLSRLLLDLVERRPGGDVEFLLLRDAAPLELELGTSAPVLPWHGSSRLAVQQPLGDDPPLPLPSDTAREVSSRLAADPAMIAAIGSSDRGYVQVPVNGNIVLALFSTIHDARGEAVGLLLSQAVEPGLVRLQRNLLLNLSLALMTLVLLGFGTYGLILSQSAKLRERSRLLTITRSLGQGLYVTDELGRVTDTNPRARHLLGWEDEGLLGRPPQATFAPELPACEPGASFRGQSRFRRADGTPLDVAITSVPLQAKDGQNGHVSLFEDIGEQLRAERDLKLAASVFNHAREGILVLSAERTIIDLNQAACQLSGYQREALLGQRSGMLLVPEDMETKREEFWANIHDQGYWQGEVHGRRCSGEHYPIHVVASAVHGDDGALSHFIVLFSDISRLKQHEEALYRVAYYDTLTGLPNRALLTQQAQQLMVKMLASSQQLALGVLDLDGFKSVNENHGSEAGDQLLMETGCRMRQHLPPGTLVGRLGGDEFAFVLTPIASAEAAQAVADQLLQAINQPIQIEGLGLTLALSGSIGLSVYPQATPVDADQLLRQADQAMYRAKQAGKNRQELFDAEHDASQRDRLQVVGEVAQALVAGELRLYYQPKVNMRSGEVLGVEALIRWQHSSRGLLGPGAFLPMIEHHPVEIEVGRWVLQTALAQARTWQAEGQVLPIAVNIAGDHVQHPAFVTELEQLLHEHADLAPGSISLEVVETSALDDVERVGEVMAACRNLGLAFELDDFGTGYSSLTYLKRLPVTGLKIDQSFVREMLDDPDDLAILEGVLGLARAFSHSVIAEGVETEEEGRVLLRLGCEHGQGYAIARPMPPDEVLAWMTGWHPPASWSRAATLPPAKMALVHAIVEHRAWVRELRAWLSGERMAAPPLSATNCKFGRRLRHGDDFGVAPDLMTSIRAAHSEVHRLAAKLVELKQSGQPADVDIQWAALLATRDDLLALMEQAADQAAV